MPSQLYNIFITRVVEEIQSRLQTFKDIKTLLGAFARKVKYNGSSRLDLSSKDNNSGTTIRRQPNATFKYSNVYWPGVVIEVLYSQNIKAILYLADNYILETNGSICIIIGLDIDYKTKKGIVSI
jgi:hypothetical protein